MGAAQPKHQTLIIHSKFPLVILLADQGQVFIQRGTPYAKKMEEIQACHWSVFTCPGFLLAETTEFSVIQKYKQTPNQGC